MSSPREDYEAGVKRYLDGRMKAREIEALRKLGFDEDGKPLINVDVFKVGLGLWMPPNDDVADWTFAPSSLTYGSQPTWPIQSPYMYGFTYHNEVPACAPPPSTLEQAVEKLKAIEPKKLESVTRDRVPDYTQPIVAWRAWSLSSHNKRIGGLGVDSEWPTRQSVHAFCLNRDTDHEAPDYDCACGIWGFRSLEVLTHALKGLNMNRPWEAPVIGTVNLWGKVIECENGWRAEYAYPKELWMVEPGLERLGRYYDVPVRVLDSK